MIPSGECASSSLAKRAGVSPSHANGEHGDLMHIMLLSQIASPLPGATVSQQPGGNQPADKTGAKERAALQAARLPGFRFDSCSPAMWYQIPLA